MATGFMLALLANARRGNWGYVAALGFALFETYYKARYGLKLWAKAELLGPAPSEAQRHAVQQWGIWGGLGLACLMALVLMPYLAKVAPGRRVLTLGGLMALGICALELIAPPRVEQVLYAPVGIFVLSAVAYFVSGLIMGAGAIWSPTGSRR